MKNITIRLEQPKDYRAVEELTRAAFNNPERDPTEHHMVHKLRMKDGIMELNFVAEMEGRIVGHIIYSHAHILQSDGSEIAVLNFGPLSVCPKMQKNGIGSALMKHSIEEAKQLGYGAIFFFGHPEYYPRFGFAEAKDFDITDCNGHNYPAFMGMELKENFLNNVTGKFIEADIYNDDLNREQAKAFDRQFCTRLKEVTMDISYRKANIDDLMIITELWDYMCKTEENCGKDEYTEILNMTREVLTNPERTMFIAFCGDKPAGFSHVYIRNEWCWTEHENGPFGYLDTIYVHPDYRKKGVAQALVKLCEDWSRERGCVEFASDCDCDNMGSLAFHLGSGFKELHRIIHFSKKL